MRPHPFVLRIPPGLWDCIVERAGTENRSVHAQILHTLLEHP